jgi:uncharacterized membrane protein
MHRYFVAGLFVLLPAWGTVLILETLFHAVDGLVGELVGSTVKSDVPGLGFALLIALVLLTGMLTTHLLGQQLVSTTETWVGRIPLVRTIYVTLKSMADLFNFRVRFGRSTVVVFPFPREGLWALGFVMGIAPPAIQIVHGGLLMMVFVPTAIHPFTGYLAFVPRDRLVQINLAPEDAMKMEFSAGLFRPQQGWLTQVNAPLNAPPLSDR